MFRRIITESLSSDPEFEVAGYAANGALALQKAIELKPDAITLDIEMPEMDGLATVRRLRAAGSKASACTRHFDTESLYIGRRT